MATIGSVIHSKRKRVSVNSVRKKPLDRLCIVFIRAYAKATYMMPISIARFSGRFIARLAYHVMSRPRRIGKRNLDRAYGDSLSQREKTAILKSSFENFGIIAAEFSRIRDIGTARGGHLVRAVGVECIDRSQGGIIVAAHLANWEWMAPCLARLGYEVAEVVNHYRDPARGEAIDALRRSGGVETISRRGAARKILRALRKGMMVGLLVDESPRQGACQVEVFGHSCWATAVPAHLALRTGTPVYVAWTKREKDDNYTVTISGPIEYEKTGDFEEDVTAYTQLLQCTLESLIRESPGQWIWTHDRWKRRDNLRRHIEVKPSVSYARACTAAMTHKSRHGVKATSTETTVSVDTKAGQKFQTKRDAQDPTSDELFSQEANDSRYQMAKSHNEENRI